MSVETATVLLAVAAGTMLACPLACLPGLHIYNILGLLALPVAGLAASGVALPPELIIPSATAMIVSWSLLNTIPSIMLGAPDESALFTVMPGQKYLMAGRGFEAVMITAVGGLGGLLALLLVAPLIPRVLPPLYEVIRPHIHWVLWTIIVFMLMSEWPRDDCRHGGSWRRLRTAWTPLAMGLLTFLSAGLLGFILLYRSPVSAEAGFQNIMPAFAGLFAVPWCLVNAVSGARIPAQRITGNLDLEGSLILRGVGAGTLGGGFAAFFPVVTGGVGGLLAGHAAAQRDDRIFLLSQGASKLIYYSGAFLLFFAPASGLTRGGGAWLMQSIHTPRGGNDYLLATASLAISGALAWILMVPLTRMTLWLLTRFDYRRVSIVALIVICCLVGTVTGLPGLAVAAVGTGIGLLPVLFGSRRLNCLGILLLPMAAEMSGIGPAIAGFLRLV